MAQKVTPVQIYNPYKFSAYRSGAQTPNGSAVIFNNEIFDTNSNFNTTTGAYTIPVSGFYQINASLTYVVTAAPQDPSITLVKNGSPSEGYGHFVQMYNGTSNSSVSISVFRQFVAGDVLTVTGANLALEVSNAAYNQFSGFLVSQT